MKEVLLTLTGKASVMCICTFPRPGVEFKLSHSRSASKLLLATLRRGGGLARKGPVFGHRYQQLYRAVEGNNQLPLVLAALPCVLGTSAPPSEKVAEEGIDGYRIKKNASALVWRRSPGGSSGQGAHDLCHGGGGVWPPAFMLHHHLTFVQLGSCWWRLDELNLRNILELIKEREQR